MSRTFFVTKPEQPTAMAAAISTLPQEQLATTIVPTPLHIDTWFDFIELLKLAPQGRRYTLWMACNTLNNMIIANILSHIRQEKYALEGAAEVNRSVESLARQGLDQAGIDKFNEQQAAIEQLHASTENREEQGYEAVAQPIDVAESLVALRSYLAGIMAAEAKEPRGYAQTIQESLAFRLSRLPVVDEKRIMMIHIASQISLEALRKADLDVKLNDRQQLLDNAGRILDTAKELSWKSVPSDQEVEGIFDSLPAQTRYRLIGNTVRALKLAMESEVKALIRFGRMDSVTNRVLINDVFEAYKAFFHTFENNYADALIAYEERGVKLPTLDELLADKN